MLDVPYSANQLPSMPGDSPDHILKTGLTALKAADYSVAIEQFAQLSRDRTVPAAIRLKAHIGWIKALKADGQAAAAIPLCQKLINHPQPKIQQWASATLASLTPATDEGTRTDAPPATDLSGFRPLDKDGPPTPEYPSPAPLPTPRPEITDPSGFRPLDPEAESTAALPRSAMDAPGLIDPQACFLYTSRCV